jgi:DNA-binding response OmpR family regulator
VLVVDDEPSIRTICRINLEAAGMEVVEAADGAAALAAIAAHRPDLVLLDVMMPGLDGWDVAVELATSERGRDVPVIFLSARSEPAARERGLELGAVGYIAKPFDPLLIAGRVAETLRRLERGEREQLRRELADEG